jgi:hypothetical protein
MFDALREYLNRAIHPSHSSPEITEVQRASPAAAFTHGKTVEHYPRLLSPTLAITDKAHLRLARLPFL